MRYLVLGVTKGLSPDRLYNWLATASKLAESDVVLICLDHFVDPELAKLCKKFKVNIHHVPSSTDRVHHFRYYRAWEYLMDHCSKACEVVVWSDVADVVFQSKDLYWTRGLLSSRNLILGSEGVRFCNEPWNSDNMHRTFPEFYDRMTQKPILCSGFMVGTMDRIKEVLWTVYTLSRNVTTHEIVDQSALNTLQLHHSFRTDVYVTDTDDPWIVHCAVSGPTRFFKEWSFDKTYMHALPKWDAINSLVTTQSGTPFAVVHQYNRIPEWLSAINAKYRQ